MKELHVIQDLEHVRLLSDPLKLKLIQAFAEGPKTARDVAEATGEKLTKLYRHIDALHDAGLIRVTAEEPKRGTVERTFEAVARRFDVEHSLFAEGNDSVDTARDLIRGGEQEILDALANADEDSQPMFARLRVRGTQEQLQKLQASLEQWLADAQSQEDDDAAEATHEAGVMLAFYPIKR